MKRKTTVPLIILLLAALAAWVYVSTEGRETQIVLTGMVTTDDTIVSAQIQGRLEKLLVNRGDEVKQGQLVATIQPEESRSNEAYFQSAASQASTGVTEAEANLRFQELQAKNQTLQAQADLDAAKAQVTQALADMENARLTFEREEQIFNANAETRQAFDQARTTYDAQKARVDSLNKQVIAAEAAVALAKSNQEQVSAREAALKGNQFLLAAASAQADKAKIQLGYTEIHAPIQGVVDVRAALQGEVINPGQAIVTLINPDDLWVRADVEETYIERVHLGDKFTVRLPSGAEREGVVFFRGVDADYATQRDVSRTKRDIKTFEVRLRCDNKDRALAVGMTAYVTLPLEK